MLLALPACAADGFADIASWPPPAAVSEHDRVAMAATREFGRRLLAQFGLDAQQGGRHVIPATRWSLGVATRGQLRWLAGAYADERSRTWLSTGISWPLADTATANLAWSQPLKAAHPQRWTLGLSLVF